MEKKSKGIIFLGVFFILLSISPLAIFYRSYTFNLNQYYSDIDKTVVATFEGLKGFESQKDQAKLKASGNLEKFNMEVNAFKRQLSVLVVNFKNKLSVQVKIFMVFNLLAGIVILVSGFGLIAHRQWARKLSFGSIVIFLLHYISGVIATCQMGAILQFVVDNVNKLNLLVDPAYTDVSAYAGKSVLMQVLFGSIYVSFLHVIVILLAGGIWWYLTRSDVKARFV